MPNWCHNDIIIRHNNPEMIARLVKASEDGKTLNEFFPCPQELLETKSPADPDVAKVNIEKYGSPDWYDWQVDNWGTKWDIGFDNTFVCEDGKMLTATFDSAWSPPISAYEKLMEIGFKIEAKYYEPGCAFVGEWIDGDDFCVDYDFSDENWRDNIPESLVDFLDVEYESWQMWQEEDKEEK